MTTQHAVNIEAIIKAEIAAQLGFDRTTLLRKSAIYRRLRYWAPKPLWPSGALQAVTTFRL